MGLEGISPLRLRRYHAQLAGRTESEAAVVVRRAEQNDQRHLRNIRSGEKPIHQRAPDAFALMIRKDSDWPHGNNRVGGDGRLARRNLADHSGVGQCRERELGNGVARLPQCLEETDLGWEGTRVLRGPETRLPKSLSVNMP